MTKIKQIQLHNFQSYENATIDLHEGINIFIGTSNHGKSAVIRALLWVITNRPMGTSFVSYWSTKNDVIDTSVKVFLDGGTVIERRRTEDFNGYIVNNTEKLEAVGHDVPLRVQELFDLTDYNVQQQFDSPFLLSSSSGEVARFFNQVIKIDDIDQMLKIVEQKKRKTRTDVSYSEKSIEQHRDSLKKLDWIDQVKDIIPVVEKLDQQIQNNKKRQSDTMVLLHEYQRRKDLYKEIDFLFIRDTIQSTDILIMNKRDREEKRKTIAGLANRYYVLRHFIKTNKNPSKEIEKCKKVIEQLNTNNRKRRMLSRLVDDLAILYKENEKYQAAEKLPGLFDKIERLWGRIERKADRLVGIRMLVDDYETREEVLIELKEQLEEIIDSMPDVCPLCGNRIKEDICGNK